MKLTDIVVEVRNKDLVRKGMIRPEDLDLVATINYNNVGIWSLNLPVEHEMSAELRTPGSGLIVYGPDDVLFSGPMTKVTFTADSDDPLGKFAFEGVTDDILLADALAYPQPTNANPATQTLAHDARTGKVEDLIHAFVNANIGPGAPSARRGHFAALLTMGTNLHRGPSTTKSARFPTLGELCNDLAITADLGFRIVQRDSGLVFETYAVQDLTPFIQLDLWNSTLASQEVVITAPTATEIIVAGQGEQVARAFLLATDPDAQQGELDWGRRIERFVDQRQTNDPAEYQQAANEVLSAEGSTLTSVALKPMDDATMNFGVDWGLGDKVATVTDDAEYSATVSSYVLVIGADAVQIGAVLGDPTRLSFYDPAVDQLTKTTARVSALERAT